MKAEFSLNKICSVSTGFEGDSFVGVKMSGDVPRVYFPFDSVKKPILQLCPIELIETGD